MSKKKSSSIGLQDHKIHFYRQIAFTFIGAGLVVLLGLLYFSMSQAIIVIHPSLENVKADFHLTVKTDTDQTSEGVKAQLIYKQIEVERTAIAQLLEEGEDQQATGTVTLINDSGRAQPLIATTRLLSEEGVLFRIKGAVTVPANGKVEAEVYADLPGKQGEIGPTRFSIPGLNQARQQEVYAQSEAPMKGGTKALYKVTQEAVDATIKEAEEGLVKEAIAKIQADGIDGQSLLTEASLVEVVSKEVEPEVDSEASKFTVKITANVAFVVANEQELLNLAQEQLAKNTNDGYELSSSDNESFSFKIVNFDPDNQVAQLQVFLGGNRRLSANNSILDRSKFVGRAPLDLRKELEAQDGIEKVDISLRPFWLRKIPRLEDHIYVQFAK